MNKDISSHLATVTQIAERNGATRHQDEKLKQIVVAAVEQAFDAKADRLLKEMRQTNQNLERAVTRLIENAEGVVVGAHDAAIAGVVDGVADDLPSLARFKADPTVIYRFKTKKIAETLGLSTGAISYLLNSAGLDWVSRKPDLWSQEIHKMTGARVWHSTVVKLLRQIILDADHLERVGISTGCENALRRAVKPRVCCNLIFG